MTSFISALSLLILVLANGCFTKPVVDEQTSSSTVSSIHDDLTTNKIMTLQLVQDDATTSLPNLKPEQPSKEKTEIDMLTSTDRLSEKDAARALRAFNQLFPSEPITSTTEKSLSGIRDSDDSLSTTVQPSTEVNKVPPRDGNIKLETPVELTTIDTPLFTSTSSVVPTERSTTPLTQKYVGLPNDDKNDEEEKKKSKSKPSAKKPTSDSEERKSEKFKVPTEDKSEEDLKYSKAPIALYDQAALGKVQNYPKEYMKLDENNDLLVTLTPEKLPTATTENKEQQNPKKLQEPKPLEQGKKPSHNEEKESGH